MTVAPLFDGLPGQVARRYAGEQCRKSIRAKAGSHAGGCRVESQIRKQAMTADEVIKRPNTTTEKGLLTFPCLSLALTDRCADAGGPQALI
jgi:hypothetical protein